MGSPPPCVSPPTHHMPSPLHHLVSEESHITEERHDTASSTSSKLDQQAASLTAALWDIMVTHQQIDGSPPPCNVVVSDDAVTLTPFNQQCSYTLDCTLDDLYAVMPRECVRVGSQPLECDKGEESQQEECAICQDAIDPDAGEDVVRELPCRHRFHRACIELWLARSQTCPCCRYELEQRVQRVLQRGGQELQVYEPPSVAERNAMIRAARRALAEQQLQTVVEQVAEVVEQVVEGPRSVRDIARAWPPQSVVAH